MKKLKIGDDVKYSKNFLRSTGILTGVIPFTKGYIVSLEDFGGGKLATIVWDSPEVPKRVLTCNLVRARKIELA